jgi:PAS domain S-box-containing protein
VEAAAPQNRSLLRDPHAERTADLEAVERRYRALVDDLGDIVVEIDAEGRLVYVNRALTELTGLSKDDLSGSGMMDFVHPDDRMIAAEHVAAAIAGADTRSAATARQVRFLAADGSVRWMSVRGRAVFDDDGNLGGFLGILHDITDSVLAEQQVRQALAEAEAARDEAEHASRAKSEFLSRMSHELRTPLNAILGFAQLLELGSLDADDSENVEQILRAGHHLLDLINEVLDVARVESGTLSLSIEPVDLSEIVAESLDLVRTAASGRGIVLRTPNHLDGSAVLADRQRLKQILVNLVSNAVKYNRADGEVVVSWVATSDQPADAAAAPHGWLRVAIADTGVGIPADRLDDVFTPFERLGAEGTEIEGTGVGLALTRTLAQALGGRVGVHSEVGAGSTFWVDLPAAKPAAQVPQPPGAPELCRTVLYVEDNPSNITLVRRVLARRPHVRLEIVQDGGEALAAAGRLVPDLVLLDLHLPGLPGDGILAAFRGSADERLRKMPIVVVTADLTPGTERRVLEAGATLFLSKPIDVRQLLQVVDDHLPRP